MTPRLVTFVTPPNRGYPAVRVTPPRIVTYVNPPNSSDGPTELPSKKRKRQTDFEDELYKDYVEVGSGASGKVYKATRITDDKQVAVKRIKMNSNRTIDLAANEIAVLRKINHQNIVGFYGYSYQGKIANVAMEYADGGSLADFIQYHGKLPEVQIATIVREILQGIEHLHSQGMVHRDIKSDNILLTKDGHVKISDLGLCTKINQLHKTQSVLMGTACWFSPEVANGNNVTTKADMWALGITIMEMLEGVPPYSRYNNSDDVLKIIAENGAPELRTRKEPSSDLQELLDGLLSYDLDERYTASQALQSRFLKRSKETSTLEHCIRSAAAYKRSLRLKARL